MTVSVDNTVVDCPRFVDTRYDAGNLLQGTSRRLVDVCTELDPARTPRPQVKTVEWSRDQTN